MMHWSRAPFSGEFRPAAPAITRRSVLAGLAAGGFGTLLTAGSGSAAEPQAGHSDVSPATASEALRRLKEGNRRFVENHAAHGHESATWRRQLVAEQHPFAVVVGCADSRVPTELVFDQGFGDLFVIRNAGNLIATDVLASIEYAVEHLKTPLVVILGHERCGAVTAALQARSVRESEPIELQAVLRMIEVALSGTELPADGDRRVLAAVEHNVRWGVKQLKYLGAERRVPAMISAQFVGAVYELQTGMVRFLDERTG